MYPLPHKTRKMEKIQVQHLKKGNTIEHPKYGCLQYRGLVSRHPFTDEPKVPHQYLFWQTIDEDGRTQPDVVLTNGELMVEVSDNFEETDENKYTDHDIKP
jgi:hypothetical protein